MKRVILLCSVLALAACSSTKPSEAEAQKFATVPDFDIHAMTRSEVISAIDQCEASDMKPFVEYLTQKTAYGKVMVPVNVHCNPIKKKL